MFKKILVTWFARGQLDDIYWDRLETLSQEIVFMNDDRITESISDIEVLLVKFNWASSTTIWFLPDLKYIGTIATWYGKIDSSLANEKGIVVTNVPGYSTAAVAEFTFAILLENLREISRAKIVAANWNYDESWFRASEISGKRFWVLWCGEIWSRVLDIARGFNADTAYWNRTPIQSDSKKKDIVSLLEDSEILSVNISLNSETENFFNTEKISKIRKWAVVINTAPMEIFDLDALVERLHNNDITFIMDHADEMSTEELDKVRDFTNFIIYPPIGYITDEARINQQEIFVSNIENYLNWNITNKIN